MKFSMPGIQVEKHVMEAPCFKIIFFSFSLFAKFGIVLESCEGSGVWRTIESEEKEEIARICFKNKEMLMIKDEVTSVC